MTTCLYLDTARLGQMCPEAQQADRDFARLAGEEAGSLYYDIFLRAGSYSLPPSLRSRYPGLADWSGVSSLKSRINTALGLSAARPLLLANRSATLVRLACRALCRQCENVLVTDMLWPAYRATLETECRQQGRILTTVPLQAPVLQDHISQGELINRVLDIYRREDCDGLLLSAVTCQGVRLPVPQLVSAVSRLRRPRFVVVDAAQAVNHAPLHLATPCCDFLIAGCHKWLQAYHPMGLGSCCRAAADAIVSEISTEMGERGELDDPLLRFTWELENQRCGAFSETVNLAPLFTVAAAVGRIWRSSLGRREQFDRQLGNADRVAELSDATGWRPVRPDAAMRSGILLLQALKPETCSAPPDSLRFNFRRYGLALSAYVGGLIRTSFLAETLSTSRLNQIRSLLRRCA